MVSVPDTKPGFGRTLASTSILVVESAISDNYYVIDPISYQWCHYLNFLASADRDATPP